MKKSDLERLIAEMENIQTSISLLLGSLKEIHSSKKKLINLAGEIELEVDYTKSIEQAIKDGKYEWWNKNISTKNFPIFLEKAEKKKILAKLFSFEHLLSSEDIISKMSRGGGIALLH